MTRFIAASAKDSDQPITLGEAPFNDAFTAGKTTSDTATTFQPTTTDNGK